MMKQRYENYPQGKEKKYSICDARIDEILITDCAVRFVFSQGFYVIQNEEITKVGYGYLELTDCEPEDFFCKNIKRMKTRRGPVEIALPISLEALSKMLGKGDKSIEITLELYDFNYLYWRGTLFPHKKGCVSNHFEIETGETYPMTVYYI